MSASGHVGLYSSVGPIHHHLLCNVHVTILEQAVHNQFIYTIVGVGL